VGDGGYGGSFGDVPFDAVGGGELNWILFVSIDGMKGRTDVRAV
jgi:hypothetical protein